MGLEFFGNLLKEGFFFFTFHQKKVWAYGFPQAQSKREREAERVTSSFFATAHDCDDATANLVGLTSIHVYLSPCRLALGLFGHCSSR